ncbi:hypothetical protein pW2_229 [Bacillus phage pW2]|uniref:Uncharacterized protein n=1 Tax=Bacillus phage pW2 TaxID=2500559 RepID=A0A3Q9R7I8_9CAUD|nr:hypothetical protein PQE69_gp113 [Bacillus phage pW2]AZU99005.1 hypothetical protein pW2_229 [Bacillus phage pW2]
MIYKIKRTLRNLKNWLPIIVKDEQWDYGFFYDMLYKKLELKEEFFRSDNPSSTDALESADQIKEVKDALKRLIDEDYITFAELQYDSKSALKKEAELKQKDKDTVFDGMKNNIERWWD